MKRIFATFVILALGFAGCHAQIPSNPTTYSCPLATTGTWTALETPANEVTALTIKDSTAPVGTWCYAVTSIINTSNPIGQSAASNVVQVATNSTDPVVDLTWLAPTSGPAPTGYIMYRIAATQSTMGAPPLNQPTTSVSELVKPALPDAVRTLQMAKKPLAPTGMVAMAQR